MNFTVTVFLDFMGACQMVRWLTKITVTSDMALSIIHGTGPGLDFSQLNYIQQSKCHLSKVKRKAYLIRKKKRMMYKIPWWWTEISIHTSQTRNTQIAVTTATPASEFRHNIGGICFLLIHQLHRVTKTRLLSYDVEQRLSDLSQTTKSPYTVLQQFSSFDKRSQRSAWITHKKLAPTFQPLKTTTRRTNSA